MAQTVQWVHGRKPSVAAHESRNRCRQSWSFQEISRWLSLTAQI